MFLFWRNGKQIPISAIAKAYSKCTPIFIRNWQTVFHNGCAIFSSPQCIRLSAAPHPHLHLIFTVFLNFYIQVCVKWYLMVLLIFISLMNNNVEIFSYPISHIYFCVCAVFVQVFFPSYWIIFLIIKEYTFLVYLILWVLSLFPIFNKVLAFLLSCNSFYIF